MMDNGLILTRRSQPGELDQHPYGTACKVNIHETHDIYIQISEDEEHPNWELLGNFNLTSDHELFMLKMNTRLRKSMQSD
jgi:hypothetical protein